MSEPTPIPAGRTGRPSKFDPDLHPKLIKYMARSGLTNEQMARELGVNESTLIDWAARHHAVAAPLQESRDFVDHLVEGSLLKRALGHKVGEVAVSDTPDGRTTKRTRKRVAPDVVACIFWLKNRRPDLWRDVQKHELTGRDGGPVEYRHQTEAILADPDAAELANALARRLAVRPGGAGQPSN